MSSVRSWKLWCAIVLGLKSSSECDRLYEQEIIKITLAKALKVAQQPACARHAKQGRAGVGTRSRAGADRARWRPGRCMLLPRQGVGRGNRRECEAIYTHIEIFNELIGT